MNQLPDGLYDRLMNGPLQRSLEVLPPERQYEIEKLGSAELRRRLVLEIARLLPEIFDEISVSAGAAESNREVDLINGLLAWIRQQGVEVAPLLTPARALRAVHPAGVTPIYPPTGLSAPWLFTAGRADPSLFAELRAELNSADRIDVLVSFITWSGLRKIIDVLESVTAVDASGTPRTRLRVITTTYMGATEARAVEKLASLPGVELKISLDGQRSRLHAKAWMFHRKSGFGSAFVGSANLSASALLNGIEWTVKFTQAGQADLFSAAAAHFETLWNDPEFQSFDPANEDHRQRLRIALGDARQPYAGTNVVALPTWFDLRPRAFQEAMLERLAAERRHGRFRNLVVAATGTGKTVVAAFDYFRQTQAAGTPPKLLFIAHRVQILQQALATFRQILRRPDFGELLAEGSQPQSHQHLFATIASVTARKLIETFGSNYWHTVIIDECHHLPADSFRRFVDAVAPRILLGLTATPERADGESIVSFFSPRPDGSPAVELRLWDALDQQLLAPFEYYATPDECDLRQVTWGRPQLAIQQLGNILGADHARARRIIDALNRYVENPSTVRAIAFCVDIAHANFMADRFNETGWLAMAVTSQTADEDRRQAPGRLASGELHILCTCDLYNEGVDIPEANTLLFLRPTQSPVVFAQQLGRGLRLAPNKDSCLVLDFVGRIAEGFRFDRIYQAMTGLSRKQFVIELTTGFTSLPPGCHIQFDRVARERVLDALRTVANQTWRRLTSELLAFAQGRPREAIRLATFLNEQCIELDDIYDDRHSGWTELKRAAGLESRLVGSDEEYFGKRFAALAHVNDGERIALMQRIANQGIRLWSELLPRERRLVQMLAYQVVAQRTELLKGEEFLHRLDESPLMREELGELAEWLDMHADLEPVPVPGLPDDWPLLLHGAYSRSEILTAVGRWSPSGRPRMSEGLLNIEQLKLQLLFVTLDKKEGFHERVAYHDYAVSPELFHWQSQNSAGETTQAGLRYIESPANGWRFQLFVRETTDHPFIALGPVNLEGIPTGNKPMSMFWKLERPIPTALFRRFTVLRT
jgi:superfamily II DNA or RNA helicase/HKD family nuclease